MEELSRTPPRGRLVNLETNEEMKFQFNPTQFDETIRARYTRINVPGLSHQRLAYEGTSNNVIPLELFMSQLAQDLEANKAGARPYVPTTRKKFLQSLLYPVTRSTAPPQVLFIWPAMVSMVGVITTCKFIHKRFTSVTGVTTELIAKIEIEEDLELGVLMEDIRRRGSASPTEHLFQDPEVTT